MQQSDGVIIVEFIKDDDLAKFYETKIIDEYEFYNNQYVLIKHKNEIVDRYRWFDGKFYEVKKHNFSSEYFGKVKPRDDYQLCLMDALMNKYNNYNNITLIKGKAGSGKSLLSLAFAFHMIFEKSIFDKIVAIINPLTSS